MDSGNHKGFSRKIIYAKIIGRIIDNDNGAAWEECSFSPDMTFAEAIEQLREKLADLRKDGLNVHVVISYREGKKKCSTG